MRGCTSSFGCLVYVFVTFWVLLFSIIFISSAKWLLDRDFYADTLTDDAFIDAIYDDALPRLYNDNVFFRQVDEGDGSNAVFGQAVREIVPKDYIVGEINNAVDAVLDYAQGNTVRLDYRLNTAVIRDNLSNPARANQFAQALVQRLPACDASPTFYGKSDLPACLPSGVTADQMAEQVTGNLSNLVTSIPEEIALFDAPRRSSDIPTFNLANLQNQATQGLIIFAGVVLLITASMGADSIKGFLRRFSIMLIIPAAIMMYGGQQISKVETNPQALDGLTITLNDKVIREGPLVDASENVLRGLSGRVGGDIVDVSQIAIIIAVVIFALSLLPMPGSGRGHDSTLQLPPSGKVGRMTSSHNSPIQGI